MTSINKKRQVGSEIGELSIVGRMANHCLYWNNTSVRQSLIDMGKRPEGILMRNGKPVLV